MTDSTAAEGSTRRVPTGPAKAADPGAPVLLVPVPELPARDGSGLPLLTLGFREVAGERVAEGFTTAERLVHARGPGQPWVAFSVADSISLLANAGASVLVVDPGSEGGAVGLDLTWVGSGTPEGRGADE
jgi:hypothetical protein